MSFSQSDHSVKRERAGDNISKMHVSSNVTEFNLRLNMGSGQYITSPGVRYTSNLNCHCGMKGVLHG